MEIKFGNGVSKFGTGVQIELTGEEVATAINNYLSLNGISVKGARTIRVNGDLCKKGDIYVDPIGSVIYDGKGWSGRGFNFENT